MLQTGARHQMTELPPAHGLLLPRGLSIELASQIRGDRWAVDCTRCTGNPIRVSRDYDDHGEAYLAALEHYEERHRLADDLPTAEEIEQAAAHGLSSAQDTVLRWAKDDKLREFDDGFWGLDVVSDRWDVNKRVARGRVIALWLAGYLAVYAAGPRARRFALTDQGRTALALCRRARRAGVLEWAAADNTFGLTAADRRRYPLMSEGRQFKGEEPAQPAPAEDDISTPAAAQEPPAAENVTPEDVTASAEPESTVAAKTARPAVATPNSPSTAADSVTPDAVTVADAEPAEDETAAFAAARIKEIRRSVDEQAQLFPVEAVHTRRVRQRRPPRRPAAERFPVGTTHVTIPRDRLDPELARILAPAASVTPGADEPTKRTAVRQGPAPTVTGAAAAVAPTLAEVTAGEQLAISAAGPGIIGPGTRIEYVDQSRRYRRKHGHSGEIVSIGRRCVSWRPRGSRRILRTPLAEMRVDYCAHEVIALNQFDPSRYRYWIYWTLADHLRFGRGEHPAAPARTAPARTPEEPRPAVQLTLFPAGPEDAPQRPAGALAGPLVVIPCSAGKLGRPAPAGELYTGSYHAACRRAADALTAQGGTVLILSARYGLVTPNQVIAPYDVRMGEPGCITVAELRDQAARLGLADTATVTILAGAAYAAAARAVWPHAQTPLAGSRGIGEHRARLATLTRPQLATAA